MGLFNNPLQIHYAKTPVGLSWCYLTGQYMWLEFNPESYKLTYKNQYSSLQGFQSIGTPARFSNSDPGEITLTLLFDGTGVGDMGIVHLAKELSPFKMLKSSVTAQLKEFLKNTTVPQGSTHEPNYLRLLWGNLDFRCKLKSADVHYKLFNRLGQPLRAEVTAKFVHTDTQAALKRMFNMMSPDVTHQRILKAGETLPMLCKEIYGKEDYFIEVARANGIDHFRDIKPGTTLIFPPLV